MKRAYDLLSNVGLLINILALGILLPGVLVPFNSLSISIFVIYSIGNLHSYLPHLKGNALNGLPSDQVSTIKWSQENLMIVRFVTNGANMQTLNKSIDVCSELLRAHRINSKIEVVCEEKLRISASDAVQVTVPKGYQTANKTLFKARALQYALETQTYDHNQNRTWILHMDDETHLTLSALSGIANAVNDNCEIGQGEIVYTRKFGHNVFTTILDFYRNVEDIGKRKYEAIVKQKVPALKGSFLLVRSNVEKKVTFDVGADGSLAEDAFFALTAENKGYKFTWIEGYMTEQSPFGISDAYRQRKRWFSGLIPIISSLPGRAYKIYLKAMLPLVIISVAISLIAIASFWGFIFDAVQFNAFSAYFMVHAISSYTITLLGLLRVHSVDKQSLQMILRITTGIIIIAPYARLLDLVAAASAILKPHQSFEVIAKD